MVSVSKHLWLDKGGGIGVPHTFVEFFVMLCGKCIVVDHNFVNEDKLLYATWSHNFLV